MSRVEQLSERVFCLADFEPMDGRSWAPEGAVGYEPFNKYVVLSEDSALLLDTGVAKHEQSYLGSLRELVGSRRLVILPTRSELDCVGNMGALIDIFPQVEIWTTARALPPAGLVHTSRLAHRDVPQKRLPRGFSLSDFGFVGLEAVEPVIRVLGTIWVFDRKDGILFCSDMFSTSLLAKPDACHIRTATDLSSAGDLRKAILPKFDWVERARTDELEKQWDELFGRIAPRVLAPGLGCLHVGERVVHEVIDAYRSALFGKRSAAGHAERSEKCVGSPT